MAIDRARIAGLARRPGAAADIALAAALAALAVADVLGDGRDARSTVALLLGGLGMTVPLAWRRSRPVLAAVVVAVALLGIYTVDDPPDAIWQLVALLVSVYSAAAHASLRPALAGAGALAVATGVSIAIDPSDELANIAPTLLIFVGIPFAAGRALHSRASAAESARRDAASAVREERARIARELHDVIAHSITVIAVQADAADAALQRDPARAPEPLAVVRRTARDAMAEMRNLLELLRTDDTAVAMVPQPGLSRLGELAEQLGRTGLPVRLDADLDGATVPPGIDLAAYRIVQEALTNVVRHAQASHAEVVVRGDRAGLSVQVRDDGRGGPAGAGGHGLVGMRERVALYGGELEAGGGDGGGFTGTGDGFPLSRVIRVLVADDQELVRTGLAS